MKFRRGYAEVQMRTPRGNLYWPAFWLVSAGDGSSPSWPAYGEIDVAEIYGSHPDAVESNFHRTGGSIGEQAAQRRPADVARGRRETSTHRTRW